MAGLPAFFPVVRSCSRPFSSFCGILCREEGPTLFGTLSGFRRWWVGRVALGLGQETVPSFQWAELPAEEEHVQ